MLASGDCLLRECKNSKKNQSGKLVMLTGGEAQDKLSFFMMVGSSNQSLKLLLEISSIFVDNTWFIIAGFSGFVPKKFVEYSVPVSSNLYSSCTKQANSNRDKNLYSLAQLDKSKELPASLKCVETLVIETFCLQEVDSSPVTFDIYLRVFQAMLWYKTSNYF